jgi:hypothetical protein
MCRIQRVPRTPCDGDLPTEKQEIPGHWCMARFTSARLNFRQLPRACKIIRILLARPRWAAPPIFRSASVAMHTLARRLLPNSIPNTKDRRFYVRLSFVSLPSDAARKLRLEKSKLRKIFRRILIRGHRLLIMHFKASWLKYDARR